MWKAKYELDLGRLWDQVKVGAEVPRAGGQRKANGKMERQFDPRVGSMMWDLRGTKRGKVVKSFTMTLEERNSL